MELTAKCKSVYPILFCVLTLLFVPLYFGFGSCQDGVDDSFHDDSYNEYTREVQEYYRYSSLKGAYEYFYLGRAVPSYCYYQSAHYADYYATPQSSGGGGVAGKIQNNTGVGIYNYWGAVGDAYHNKYHD